MLEGNKWDESKFKLRKAILNFHEYISNSSADIFKFGDYENKIDAVKFNFSLSEIFFF